MTPTFHRLRLIWLLLLGLVCATTDGFGASGWYDLECQSCLAAKGEVPRITEKGITRIEQHLSRPGLEDIAGNPTPAKLSRRMFRPTRKKNGKTVKARTHRGRFTVGDDPRVYDVVLRVTDKQVALQLLRERQKEMERERAGLIAPRSERDAAKQPIAELVEECFATKAALGKDDRYLRQLRCQLAKLGEQCGWSTVADISSATFERWRS